MFNNSGAPWPILGQVVNEYAECVNGDRFKNIPTIKISVQYQIAASCKEENFIARSGNLCGRA